jgi:Ni,Fe-hydrogenase I small subunit
MHEKKHHNKDEEEEEHCTTLHLEYLVEKESSREGGKKKHTHTVHWIENVRCCDCAEAFLASSVPDLQFDFLATQLNGANFEVDTSRRQMKE